MSDGNVVATSGFRIRATAQEFWALLISLAAVFVLVQFGAPIVRELDFLDPKLREYFIGIAFAAFPLIHRSAKNVLAGFTMPALSVPDQAPWYVTGVFAAAILFAWNQFVSACAAFSLGLLLGMLHVDTGQADFAMATAVSMLAVSLPLSAAAAVLAGVILNRRASSHPFAALVLAAVTFVSFNALLTWTFQPEYLATLWASSGRDLASVLIGVSLVGVIVIAFGAIGIAISRFRGDASVTHLVQATRHLSPQQREAAASVFAAAHKGALAAP